LQTRKTKRTTKRRKKRKVVTNRRSVAISFTIALILSSSALIARSDSKPHLHDPFALLFGTIFGPDGHTLYGVRITIRRSDQKKPKWELTSDHQGEFAQRVPAGKADYIITADVKAQKGQPKPELTVHVENDERKDFALHLK
jgi:hypothetical protein